MIHFVVHDEHDSVGVVVVEGVKSGQELNGWIMDENKDIEHDGAQGHPDRPQDGAQGHGSRADTVIKYGVDIGRWWRRSRRASTPTCTTSRPKRGGSAR